MHLTVVLDQLSDDLELVVRTDIEVGLHALNDRLVEVFRVNLEHDLEWEALENGELTPEVVRVLVNRQPNLHRIV